MTSDINPTRNGYNQLYPVAGTTNSSQGFRNNFTAIHDNFNIAKNEIDRLHNKKFSFNDDSQIINIDTSSVIGAGNDDIVFNFKIMDNVCLGGKIGVTVPHGLTSDRPTTGNGIIRYNTSTKVIEIGANDTWLTLSDVADKSTYIRRWGDILRGSLSANSKSENLAQFLGDTKVISNKNTASTPSFAFIEDAKSGLTYSDKKSISLTINNTNLVNVLQQNTNNISNFSPSIIPESNIADKKNTKIHGQYMGFQRTHEYYIHRIVDNTVAAMVDVVDPPIISFDTSVIKQNVAVGFTFDFMTSGVDNQFGFVMAGQAMGSFFLDGFGNFILTTPPTVTFHTTKNNMSVIDTKINVINNPTKNSIDIVVSCKSAVTADSGLNFDITGKMTIHFGSQNVLPINIDGSHS